MRSRLITAVMHTLVAFLAAPFLMACIWYHGTAPDGTSKQYEPLKIHGAGFVVLRATADTFRQIINSDNSSWEVKVSELATKSGFAARNDYAVALIYTGDYEQAIKVLHELEEQASNPSYEVAANLGTAYELSGNLDQALKWITEGMKRDPKSHYGTEWLHQRIIQTKLDGKSEVFELENPLDFDNPQARYTAGEQTFTSEELITAILYQTSERAAFVKPEDGVMANLFAMGGNVIASTVALEPAIDMFELAVLYGHPKSQEIQAWFPEARKIIAWNNNMRSLRNAGLWAAGIGAFIVAAYLAVRYQRKKRNLPPVHHE